MNENVIKELKDSYEEEIENITMELNKFKDKENIRESNLFTMDAKDTDKKEISGYYYDNRYRNKKYGRTFESNALFNLRREVGKTIRPEYSKLLMKKKMNFNSYIQKMNPKSRIKTIKENADHKLNFNPVVEPNKDSVTIMDTSSRSSVMLNKFEDEGETRFKELENKYKQDIKEYELLKDKYETLLKEKEDNMNEKDKMIEELKNNYMKERNNNYSMKKQNEEQKAKLSNLEEKYYQMLHQINSDENNKLMDDYLSDNQNKTMINAPSLDTIEENSPSGADIAKKSKQSKYHLPSLSLEDNPNDNTNKNTPLQNELANIINENNNIGREIFKMNEENKKLIKLLETFTASSLISKEKKKNLETYITSQATLLNDAKRIFVEEYNKMKTMEQEISTLKSNNSYMKKKLKECRENEFRMKLQSSNDKYLLHTLTNSVNAKRYLNTMANTRPKVSKHISAGNVLNDNQNNNNKIISFDKNTAIPKNWKHHEETCNQQ